MNENTWQIWIGAFPSPHLSFHRITSSFSLMCYEYFRYICIFCNEENRFQIQAWIECNFMLSKPLLFLISTDLEMLTIVTINNIIPNSRVNEASRIYIYVTFCFYFRCRLCFQLLTFDIGYGNFRSPVVMQVSVQRLHVSFHLLLKGVCVCV